MANDLCIVQMPERYKRIIVMLPRDVVDVVDVFVMNYVRLIT